MSNLDPANGRRPNGAAFIIAAGLAGIGVLLIWQGSAIPDRGGYAGVASGDAPRFVGICLLLLAAAHIWSGLRHRAAVIPKQERLPVVMIIAGLALQLTLLHPLGFSVASGILFACTAAAFGKRNVAITLPIGIGFAVLVYGVFDQLLKLNLPAGFLENLIFGG